MKFLTLTAFFNLRKLREYQPLSLAQNVETAFTFHNGDEQVSCNVAHVFYEPMLVQITFPEKPQKHTKGLVFMAAFDNPTKISAILQVELQEEFNIATEKLFFYKVIKSKLQLSFLKKLYIKKLYRNSIRKNSNFMHEFTLTTYQNLVALFSFPKPVWLVSIRNKASFPVDLYAKQQDIVTIGVRNTNHGMHELEEGDSFYISSAAAEDYEKIYSLGKFSTTENTVANNQVESGIYIPDVVCDCQKLVLLRKIKFEHQTLYVSKTIELITINNTKFTLYHVHKIWLWNKTNYLKIEK